MSRSPRLKTYFNWSSGKDAALALYHLQKDKSFAIDKLVTTVNEYYDRVSMHGLRSQLLRQQVQEIGLPLETVALPQNPSMKEYEQIMAVHLRTLQAEGFKHCGFGDIFLEDLKTYREQQMLPFGIGCSFPLWKRPTVQLLDEFVELGFKAIIICINADVLDVSFVGREIDKHLVKDLPKTVDPCGENGEFHTFCYDAPLFKKPVRFKKGEKTFREYPLKTKEGEKKSVGFWFLDLIPD